jgi:hypothetical protein
MPAGDSKNEPHREKKPSFFFQCGRAITRKQDIEHQQPAVPRHNHTTRCSAGTFAAPQRARSQGKTRKKQQSKWFFFPPEERVPFSQPRKDDGVRVATARAPSQRLSAHAMGQHNNQKGAIGAKERQERNNNQNGFSFSS